MHKQIQANWHSGQFQDQHLNPPHDRGVFCAAVNDTFIATGSADNGIRIFNANTGKYCRELFNKRYGHKEWVTTCAYLPNGKLISGGMDGMLCLWERNIVKCDTLMGHKTSISKVKVDENNICISASYDCTMNIWDLDDTRKSDKLFGPHKNPILDFDWKNSLVVSGDKDGVVAFWDINQVQSFKKVKCHGGAVASVHLMSDSIDNH